MKYKKSFIFICLIICLFSIASVCASDVNETVVANDYNGAVGVTTHDAISFSTKNNVLKENITDGTLTDIVELINEGGNEINLTKDYSYDSNIDQSTTLIINKTIAIDGNGHNIKNSISILGDNVVLKNINFNKVKISWSGKYGMMINCTVSNYYGDTSIGAMSILGNDFTIINSTLSSNTVKAYEYGGAITWWGNNGKIINSIFDNNKNLYYYGGAIHWRGNNGYVLNCSFIDNYAEEFGGAIYGNEKANIQINDSTFIHNRAKKYGGALYVRYHLEASNCTFVKNEGRSYAALYSSQSSGRLGIVNNSLFYMNKLVNTKYSTDNYICSMNKGNVINCIFLNNTAQLLLSAKNADYNWFGSTINDYLITPNNTNSLNNWLFLDTANDELMLFEENNSIQLIFKIWNGSNILDYDYSNLHNCGFELTSHIGELDKTSAVPGDIVLLNASKIGNGSIVAKFLDNNFTFNFICKYPTKIIANESITIYVDQFMNFDNGGLYFALNPSKAGNLSYSSDNNTILTIENNGFKGLNYGTANIIIKFEETEDYAPSNASVSVTVIRYDTEITANDTINIDFGDSTTIDAILNPNIGNVIYISDDANIAVVDKNGFISTIGAGTTNIIVKFEGDRKYKPSNKTIALTVNKIDSSIILNGDFVFDYGGSDTVSTTVNGIKGINAFVLNHPGAIVNFNNNRITVSNLNVGDYILNVTTIPDNNHDAVTITANITVNKIDSLLVIPETMFDYDTSASINSVVRGVTDITNVGIINHPEANIIVKNNIIEISNLAIGTYILTATTIPDINHNAVTNTTKITVTKPNSSIKFTKEVKFDYGSSDTTTAILNGATGIANVKVVNHPEAIININKNVISVSGLDEGIYTLTVTSIPDSNHNAVTNTTKITVMKYDSSIRFSNDIVFDYGCSASTNVILNGASGITNVKVVNHPEAIISIENNILSVSGLNAGSYTLTATTIPNKIYNAVTGTAKVQVNQIDSNIEFAKDIVFNYGGSEFSSLKISGAIGMDISVVGHPNTEIYYDESSISLYGLDVGNYKFSITLIPDENHNFKTITVPFKVNKINSKLTVKKINGYTASSTLKAVVEDAYGYPIDEGMVKFVVGGRNYQVKVYDGVAKLNIKLSKAKAYSYKATFVSDNFYSKTASSKLVVKQSQAKISLNKITCISGDYFTLKAIVKNSAGKKLDEGSVKFSINGKTYNVNVKNGVATKKLKLSAVKTYTYKATFSSKYYKSKVVTSKAIIKKQPVYTVKIGKYSIKISYKDYKKIKMAKNEGYFTKQYYTGKTIAYKVYKDKKFTLTKKKLYSYGTYTTYFINNPDAMVAPYGYYFAGKEFKTVNGIEKVYMVYKKSYYKKVLVSYKQAKVYIIVDSSSWGTHAQLFHKEYVYYDKYGGVEIKNYVGYNKKIF